MPVGTGRVVSSLAGRDAGGFFAVVSEIDGYVFLADGKERPLDKPKRKSVKHIRKTNTVLDFTSIGTNLQLRKALDVSRVNEGGIQLV